MNIKNAIPLAGVEAAAHGPPVSARGAAQGCMSQTHMVDNCASGSGARWSPAPLHVSIIAGTPGISLRLWVRIWTRQPACSAGWAHANRLLFEKCTDRCACVQVVFVATARIQERAK